MVAGPGPQRLIPWLALSLCLHGGALALLERPAPPASPATTARPLAVRLLAPAPPTPTAASTATPPSTPHREAAAEPEPLPPQALPAPPAPTPAVQPANRGPVTTARAPTAEAPPAATEPAPPAPAVESAATTDTSPEVGAAPSSTTAQTALQELYRHLHDAIDRHKHYPLAARRMRREGTARVSFRLARDGAVDQIAVVDSSGHRSLDRAAVDAVQGIHPFRPAADYLEQSEQLQVEIVFRL